MKPAEDRRNQRGLAAGFTISDAGLERVAAKLGMDVDELFGELMGKKYIDRNKNVRAENSEKFFEEYPGFGTGLKAGKVTDRKKRTRRKSASGQRCTTS